MALKSFSEWLTEQGTLQPKPGTLLETFMRYPPPHRERLLNEAPHAYFAENVPDPNFEFVTRGGVDLGFENFNTPEHNELKRRCHLGFLHNGVRIPGTPFKMRSHPVGGVGLIEPAGQDELPVLPDYWRQCVLVVENEAVWIGKRVRPDQIGNVDLSRYQDVGDGWELVT